MSLRAAAGVAPVTRGWGPPVLDAVGPGWSHGAPVEAGAELGSEAAGTSVESPPKTGKLPHRGRVRNSPATAQVEEEEESEEGEEEQLLLPWADPGGAELGNEKRAG